jgi:hypothetical protein
MMADDSATFQMITRMQHVALRALLAPALIRHIAGRGRYVEYGVELPSVFACV